MTELEGKRFIVGISGGIAAYKSVELVRLLRKEGAEVQVLLTPDATRFVTPLTLGTLSEREVMIEIFPPNESGSWTRHVHLGLWADLMIVAPATANTLSKLVSGACDSMLTAVALSARCPMLVCPAMDHDMYEHASTQANLETLRGRGVEVMDAPEGPLASGLVGKGRLPEPGDIVARAVGMVQAASPKLEGPRVLVTAGPTRESLDPVRFLTNRSSGAMGFEIARSARRLGCRVTLVSGPSALETPDGVHRIDVESAADMYDAVMARRSADVIIMAAAVADYTPAEVSSGKIKKKDGEMVLRLKRTRDILKDLGASRDDGQTLVGFALETDDAQSGALKKLHGKNVDWIVLNNPTEQGAGFGPGTNKVTLFGKAGQVEPLPVMPKSEVALAILGAVMPGLAQEA
ncbi:MAG: bifunctional phosphopantothenoylcysteine decarboxylase/phosphopantothenate--cysteine ligase CoaBC [Rhodothermales bacterium]|nr:bifunctional phosphopantothenoylcysteine decarboxylase/phosphopantothenate--cysteine ligase CoaBC [Rhodothermales bacterium]MBO6778807.1 bifunctional phosphopantothenoylcysteine decarboxylase/phosphopantothenate--cysteine ligase CoaBC [Rhodothermales bacterium]